MILKWIKQLLGVFQKTTHIEEPLLSVSIPLPSFHRTKEMESNRITLKRHTYTDESTIGDLIGPDGATLLCYTLEDTVRRKKEKGITAIPAGEYEIILNEFGNTGKIYPFILNVPFFTGIFIHAGNSAQDSLGCILVGMRHDKDRLFDSQKALHGVVIPTVKELLGKGRLRLSVLGGYSIEEWEKKAA